MSIDQARRHAAALVAEEPPQPGVLELLKAIADGELDVVAIDGPLARWPAARLQGATTPMIILVSAAAPPTLPSDWRTAERLRRWCMQAMVREDTEPTPADTRRLIAAARRAHRLALIETLGERVLNWRAWFGAKLLPPMTQGDLA